MSDSQLFKKYDLVKLNDELSPMYSHHSGAGQLALIKGSYKDIFGYGDTNVYSIFLEKIGETSWYSESDMKLIESNREDLYLKWNQVLEDKYKEQSDLDWIFANPETVIKNRPFASIQSLSDCFDGGNIWGPKGEGVSLFYNIQKVLIHAGPFLLTGNKQGWLDLCDKGLRGRLIF